MQALLHCKLHVFALFSPCFAVLPATGYLLRLSTSGTRQASAVPGVHSRESWGHAVVQRNGGAPLQRASTMAAPARQLHWYGTEGQH
jgi:hypothetical protein